MHRRSFIRVLSGGVIAAAVAPQLVGCAHASTTLATSAWRTAGREQDPRRWILSHALLAPHAHNLQGWVVDLGGPEDELVLSLDPERLLPVTDPLSRQILVSHGTFLEVLSLAAAAQGRRAEIALFPEGPFGDAPDTRPVAHVRLVADSAAIVDPLFNAVFKRRTSRAPYDPARPVPASAWDAMAAAVAAAEGEGGALRFGFVGEGTPELQKKHRELAYNAWRIELTTAEAMLETYGWLRLGEEEINAHRDGIAITDPMPVWLARLGLFDRTKAPAPDDYATTSQLEEFRANIDSTPGFMWITSVGNDRATQVKAGRAYVRAQLAAAAAGVSMQPLSQALQEYPEQAQAYADAHRLLGAAEGETVQMWTRVGFGPVIDPAPRRGLEALIRA